MEFIEEKDQATFASLIIGNEKIYFFLYYPCNLGKLELLLLSL